MSPEGLPPVPRLVAHTPVEPSLPVVRARPKLLSEFGVPRDQSLGVPTWVNPPPSASKSHEKSYGASFSATAKKRLVPSPGTAVRVVVVPAVGMSA